MRPKLLVITPVKHIGGVAEKLEAVFDVSYFNDPVFDDIAPSLSEFDAIFTNPNKSKIYLGQELIEYASNLKIICTASTGTNHIDLPYATQSGIAVISIKEEREIIEKISSTAEHAFALTLGSLRNLIPSHRDVLKGNWNYEEFVGRQLDGLTIGVVGYGRLGLMYANYCLAFGSRVLVFDPYVVVGNDQIVQMRRIEELLPRADVIAFHVHLDSDTQGMVNQMWLEKMKADVLLVNTSRGEIINELDLVEFLIRNRRAKVAVDVLTDEVRRRDESPLLRYSKSSDQVLITPHIGGMTREAQELAYNHAANRLIQAFL
jgi:phosphoglycerate dehydrogenase-like enzyme